ncbi:peptidyl-alpha-hydroxyglycine alpha-amidating lyase 2 [Patella vulgata]|uniref:peptidyl-alpha-hydroxyglycine alpha-amidating lyase 2 n=1 Tax=Patella vulgata TaxID=6465 RepID=UPI0024A7BFC3|nr:peptidyl-alpha-hydroxyglycine alpha-amidating lyase 2 [Patella vulgata]
MVIVRYFTIASALLVSCFSFPTDLNIRNILDKLYTFPDTPEILSEDPNWPDNNVNIGQIGGLAIAPNNDLVVFHRGSRKWEFGSFNRDNTYAQKDQGPIAAETIVQFDVKNGKKINGEGANKYYMPHGLTIDGAGNKWVTDVALHQVFRIPSGQSEPDLELGTAFVPGKTNNTFCKPTDVAVASNGDFFVADGYCNGRVMKFSKDGSLITEWGHKSNGPTTEYTLNVPHSLSLVEELDLLCVADREDSRIMCYRAGIKDPSKTGVFDETLVKFDQIGRVFAIEYSPVNKVMYAVVSPEENELEARGFTVEMNGRIVDSWGVVNMGSHSQPHDVTVSKNGNDVFVGDIGDVRPVTRFRKRKQIYVG